MELSVLDDCSSNPEELFVGEKVGAYLKVFIRFEPLAVALVGHLDWIFQTCCEVSEVEFLKNKSNFNDFMRFL